MPQQPSRFTNDVYAEFPDDSTTKLVELQAAGLSYAGIGDRHVLLSWSNGEEDGNPVTQIIQLSGQAGNYAFYSPHAKKCESGIRLLNTLYPLGNFTRAQRDRILELADAVNFKRTSTVNSCRTWTRDLLEMMVNEGLLSQNTFQCIDQAVPLLQRVPEV